MRRLLVLAAAPLVAACQQGPATHPPVAKTLSTAEQLKVDGDAFLAKGDYVNAVEKYRQAVDLEPTAIPPRFALGTAFSFLDKRAEATVQFRWVLARADASSTEYQDARRWLISVSALVVPAAAVDTPQREQARPVDPSLAGDRLVPGQWPDVTPLGREGHGGGGEGNELHAQSVQQPGSGEQVRARPDEGRRRRGPGTSLAVSLPASV